MFTVDQYELLDFGEQRKLERFSGFILDRPAPAATGRRCLSASQWRQATARFRRTARETGSWSPADALPPSWSVSHGGYSLELKPTPFGHVGLFPEHAGNWDWIADHVRRAERNVQVLNLFAYTGGATLAASAAGASVVHLDAARNVVQWARRNARRSGLNGAPIRWIVEDARRFVDREMRRGNRYDAVVLDPPSYGHGPKGHAWKIERDLVPLLDACHRLLVEQPVFFLVTCHSPQWGPKRLRSALLDAGSRGWTQSAESRTLVLTTADGRRLPSGVSLRWPSCDTT